MSEIKKITEEGETTKESCHVHKVGTVTCGIVFVLFGVLFLVHTAIPELQYQMIFRCWPVILILLGIEILLSGIRQHKEKEIFQYDFSAVILITLMSFFAMMMAVIDYAIRLGGSFIW